MMTLNPHPTQYPDVNAMVAAILAGAQGILGGNFIGMYLGGSLAGGDFDPQNSDIDFIVVTATELSGGAVLGLTAMHARLAAGPSKWATEIEGSYILLQALRRYDPARAQHPHIFRGTREGESRLAIMQHGSDWILQRHIMREQGMVLAGPAPSTLIDPIQPAELRRATLALAGEYLPAKLRDPDQFHHDGYHAFMVVTLCRILYTVEHGTVVSKPVAARWAQTLQGGRWAALIERAVAWEMRWEYMDETLAFVRYTLGRCGQLG